MILEDSYIIEFIFSSKEYLLFLFMSITLLFCNSKKAIYLFLILVVFFAVFRGGIGGDFINYKLWYITTLNDNNLEFGYVFLMNLFNYLDLSIFHLQFFFSIIFIILTYFSIKQYTKNDKFAWLLFIIFPYYYLNSFVLIRQYFAIGIIFIAFSFLIKKKYLYYLLLILIGTSIHYSCLLAGIFVFLIFQISFKVSKTHLILLFCISIPFAFIDFIYIFKYFFIGSKYQIYFNTKNISPINNLLLFLLNLETIFLLINYDKLIKYNFKNKYFLLLAIFGFILINFFASFNHFMRFFLYFKIFELIILADFLFLKNNNKTFLILIMFYGLSHFLYVLNYDFKNNEIQNKIVPYKNILLK